MGKWNGRRGRRHSVDAYRQRSPQGQVMEAREQWIARHAAEIRAVLADAGVREEVLGLLGGDDQEQRRLRRLAELATELDGMELTLRLRRDNE